MTRFRRFLVVLVLSLITVSFISADSYALWPWGKPGRPRKRAVVTPPPKKSPTVVKPVYIEEDVEANIFDLNRDGKVNEMDSLLWANSNKDKMVGVMEITDDNAILFGPIDMDSNGRVTKEEASRFCMKYDRNNNGILEQSEIDAAA